MVTRTYSYLNSRPVYMDIVTDLICEIHDEESAAISEKIVLSKIRSYEGELAIRIQKDSCKQKSSIDGLYSVRNSGKINFISLDS